VTARRNLLHEVDLTIDQSAIQSYLRNNQGVSLAPITVTS